MRGAAADRPLRARLIPAVVVALTLGPLHPTGARAMGALQHPSIEQSAAGVRGILFYTLSAGGPYGSPSFRVEASEIALYGVPGLRLSGVRVGGRAGAVSLVAEAARLSADGGSETRLAVTPAVFLSNWWAASLGLVYESAVVDGMPSARLASATGRSLVRLSRTVSVGGEVARYRLFGEANDGADVTMAVVVRPLDGATIRAVVAVGRWSGAQPSLSTTIGSPRRFRLTIGYESSSEALKGALAVSLGGLTCAAGANYHPVLGSRHGVTLTWGW